ncbi:MAG: N-acetyl-gamma-glutamyl-phosphate reductase [bacterium]
MTSKLQVSIVGASGYTGGELLRILVKHPNVEIKQATSERFAGKMVTRCHPNLRKLTTLQFCSINELEETDLLFLCLPHNSGIAKSDDFMKLAPRIIDLSADYRLKDPADYPIWYEGFEHPRPELLKQFVYGIPELHREEMKNTKLISSAGCLATASILGIYPLLKHGVVELEHIVIEGKTGSSASGNKPTESSIHAERSGVIRSFKPTAHRHAAEMVQELTFNGKKPTVSFTATSVEAVRGILATSHLWLNQDLEERDIWQIYREEYGTEPFIRLVKEKGGSFRYPEPKILAGTNLCDIGFEKDPHSKRIVVMSAIDNLMKGASGQAVQALNIMMGWEETLGLDFVGLHPV